MTVFMRLVAAVAVLALAGCANLADDKPDSTLDQVSRAAYVHNGPPELTLYTMINNRSGAGAHTSLMINGSQRVIFDPAGTIRLSAVPERGDVLYGINPTVEDFYERAHARETFHVVIQTVQVSPEVAERALQLAINNGSVSPARCAASTAAILRQLPGFENVTSTWFPKRLMESFGEIPGVETRRLFENDADDKAIAVAEFEQGLGITQ